MAATASAPGRTATANAAARRRSVTHAHAAMTAASGTRFGLMRIATDAASPASAALRSEVPSIPYTARAQKAEAGTSLICDLNIIRKVGLVAMSHAALMPIRSDATRRPIRNVVHTSSAPVIGTTRNAAACPPRVLNAAIRSGRPGPVIGVMDDSPATALYPNGVDVASAFGHGTCPAIVTGTFRLPASHRSICDTYE